MKAWVGQKMCDCVSICSKEVLKKMIPVGFLVTDDERKKKNVDFNKPVQKQSATLLCVFFSLFHSCF